MSVAKSCAVGTGWLVFHDRGIWNRKTALVFVNDLPLFGGFAPVKFFGRIDIQIVAAIALLELHQQQVIFTGIIENTELAVFDFNLGPVAVDPAFVAIPALEVTAIGVEFGARVMTAVFAVVEALPVENPA